MKTNNTNGCIAYALGYYHGRAEGVENNTFDADAERYQYRLGYDAGIADYCHEAHPEDEN